MKVKLDPGAFLPERAHNSDAGLDLRIPKCADPVVLKPKGSATIDTGVHVAIPDGFCGLLISKSGLNVKYGILSDGLIDSGYTGSIRVKLYNLSDICVRLMPGDKCSQLVIMPYYPCGLEKVDALEATERGDNGFGSTGR